MDGCVNVGTWLPVQAAPGRTLHTGVITKARDAETERSLGSAGPLNGGTGSSHGLSSRLLVSNVRRNSLAAAMLSFAITLEGRHGRASGADSRWHV